MFRQDDYGDQPDQRRASVLPTTAKLIEQNWQNLFPAALHKSGALAMRKYLRTLTTDNSSLHDIAAPHLADVDQLVIKSYFAQAKVLMGKKNFAATRAKYKQIIAEYLHSAAANRADAELPRVIPIGVNYFQKVADANFTPPLKSAFRRIRVRFTIPECITRIRAAQKRTWRCIIGHELW